MALTLQAETHATTGLEEYINHIEAHVDLKDIDSIKGSAEELRKLANNRSFLAEKINTELSQWEDFQPTNSYTAQTMMLGFGTGFFVRANVWEPVKNDEGKEFRDTLFAYQVPHDHNFTFMTVGYRGSGYETELYEHEAEDTNGKDAGDSTSLLFIEKTRLTQGKVMMYRCNRDIHLQHPPEDLSISINLMITPTLPTNQYYFDVNKRVISQVIPSAPGLMGVCRLAGWLGNHQTIEHLESIGKTHIAADIRLCALASLAKLDINQVDAVRRIGVRDPSEMIRRFWQEEVYKASN